MLLVNLSVQLPVHWYQTIKWYSINELLEHLYIGHECNDSQDDFYSIWIPLNWLFFIFVNRLVDGLIWRNCRNFLQYVGLKIHPLWNAGICWDGPVQELAVMRSSRGSDNHNCRCRKNETSEASSLRRRRPCADPSNLSWLVLQSHVESAPFQVRNSKIRPWYMFQG